MGGVLKFYLLIVAFYFMGLKAISQEWKKSEIPFDARIVHTMTSSENGYYILGGRLTNGKGRSNETLLITKNGEFQTFKSFEARDGQTLISTDNNQLLAFGGISEEGIHNDLWVFQKDQWKQIKVTGKKPPKRWGHAATYMNGKLFIYGGKAEGKGNFHDDLWEWNGTQWKELKSSLKPSGRYGAQFGIYKGKLILYGGRDHSGNWFKDTWVWENGWKQLTFKENNQPNASVGFVMITATNKLFLIGGILKGDSFKEIWEFTGNEWNLIDRKLPFSLDFAAGCYDQKSNSILISGSYQNNFQLWKLSL